MDKIFKALGDKTRREILDRLFDKPGQTLGELCNGVAMRRQSLSKHLKILSGAGLITTQWQGREKLHYLNPLPIAEISDRWIDKFSRTRSAALLSLKKAIEEKSNEKS